MRITTGKENYEILDAGSVATYNNEPLTFHIDKDLRVIFIFKTDVESKEVRLDFDLVNSSELEIILINFNNSLGNSNVDPLLIGEMDGREIYLNFTVYSIDEVNSKNIHYTLYLREEVANG